MRVEVQVRVCKSLNCVDTMDWRYLGTLTEHGMHAYSSCFLPVRCSALNPIAGLFLHVQLSSNT